MQCLLDSMIHFERWFTLINIDHTVSVGFYDECCMMFTLIFLDKTMFLARNIAGWFAMILIDHTMSHSLYDAYYKIVYLVYFKWRIQCRLNFMAHTALWFTLITINHTMSLGFLDVNCKMVYLDSHRPYKVFLNS